MSTFGVAAETDVSTFTLRAASARCCAVSVYCDASAFAYARRTISATGSSSGSPLRSARSSAVRSLRASIASFGSSAASAVSSDADTSDTLRTSGSSRWSHDASFGFARRAASTTSDVLPAPR